MKVIVSDGDLNRALRKLRLMKLKDEHPLQYENIKYRKELERERIRRAKTASEAAEDRSSGD